MRLIEECENSFPIAIGSRAPRKIIIHALGSYFRDAKIAQLVERHLAKVEVAGSNPVFRSTETLPVSVFLFLLGWWNW